GLLSLAARYGRIAGESPERVRSSKVLSPGLAQSVVGVLGIGAAITFAVVNVVGTVGEPYINAQWVPIVRQFFGAAEALPQAHSGPILVDFEGDPRLAGAVQSGLINLLEKHGVDARARRDQGLQFGGHRVQT